MYPSPFCPLLPIKWMLCKKTFFFSTTCVCILCVCVCVFFFTHTKSQKPKPFFLLGLGGDIICKRDRWWVYWLLIIYTLLLAWQFSRLIYIFFKNVEIFKKKFPLNNKRKYWTFKKILFGWNVFSYYLFI
jgi:hypothetical protein